MILEVDPAAGTARVRPVVVLDRWRNATAPTGLAVVQNWSQELKRLVATR